jgi:hypothetical protein
MDNQSVSLPIVSRRAYYHPQGPGVTRVRRKHIDRLEEAGRVLRQQADICAEQNDNGLTMQTVMGVGSHFRVTPEFIVWYQSWTADQMNLYFRLFAMCCLNAHERGSIYRDSDKDFLRIVCNEGTIAVGRGRLYEPEAAPVIRVLKMHAVFGKAFAQMLKDLQ